MSDHMIMELEEIVIPNGATINSLAFAANCVSSQEELHYFSDKYFEMTARGPRDLSLLSFMSKKTSDDVQAFAEGIGCGMGLLEDLLVVSAHPQYRDLQREGAIIALGSSILVKDWTNIPALSEWDRDRSLYLSSHTTGVWPEMFRFLLVRKDSN